jgi:hypothetical protein
MSSIKKVSAAVLTCAALLTVLAAAPTAAASAANDAPTNRDIEFAKKPSPSAKYSIAFLDGYRNNAPVRWNPCVTRTWKLTTGMRKKDKAALTWAFGQLNKATGMNWVQTTSNTHDVTVDFTKDGGYRQRWTMSRATYGSDRIRGHYTRGALSFVMGKKLSEKQRQYVYLRSVGYIAGLDPVLTKRQVMGSDSYRGGKVKFRSGDKAGLRLLGRQAGCMNPPDSVTSISYSWTPQKYSDGNIVVKWVTPTNSITKISDSVVVRYYMPNGEYEGGSSTDTAFQNTLQLWNMACVVGARLQILVENEDGISQTWKTITSCPKG